MKSKNETNSLYPIYESSTPNTVVVQKHPAFLQYTSIARDVFDRVFEDASESFRSEEVEKIAAWLEERELNYENYTLQELEAEYRFHHLDLDEEVETNYTKIAHDVFDRVYGDTDNEEFRSEEVEKIAAWLEERELNYDTLQELEAEYRFHHLDEG